MKKVSLLLTCEHASRQIPASLRPIFLKQKRLLSSHRSWDAGALSIARTLSETLKAPLVKGRFSRLVVDLNRSVHHRGIFSEFTRKLPVVLRQNLLATIHTPFRAHTRQAIERSLAKKHYVCHLSIHSFTPVLSGGVRNCEVGILYDPRRPLERYLAQALKNAFAEKFPNIRLRMNYPYRGTSDGHTASLRKFLSDRQYAGIEIEFNQAWKASRKPAVQKEIAAAIQNSLEAFAEHEGIGS